MLKEPLYKSIPTFRNYEDYHDAEQYTKGWNDAMHFIFDSDEEKIRKVESEDKGGSVMMYGNDPTCGNPVKLEKENNNIGFINGLKKANKQLAEDFNKKADKCRYER